MKKYFIFLAMTFIVNAWIQPAHGLTAPGYSTGICKFPESTCPEYGKFSGGTMYGCGTATSCGCVIAGSEDDTSGVLTPTFQCMPCTTDSDCDGNGYCTSNGECKERKSCSNCTSSSWSDSNPGYQHRIIKTCDYSNGTCNSKDEYRCAKNYFGESFNGTSGCARCYEAVGAVTDGPGATANTACYIPTTTPMQDSTGTYYCSEKAYYKR